MDDEIRFTEVYFFIHLQHEGDEVGLTLVSLYLLLQRDLLCISHGTLWSCEHQGDLALRFVDIRAIKSVVEIIPHLPVIRGQEVREHFFLVEKPGFDVALIAGTEEDISSEGNAVLDTDA